MSDETERLIVRYASALAQEAGSSVYLTGGKASSEAYDALLAHIRAKGERIAALEAEVGQLRELLNIYNLGGWTDAERLQRERDEARAEVERLRPDAERYAWLRDWRIRRDGEQFEVRRFEEGLIGRPGKWYYPSGEILDAAIDAARKAGEQS